MEPDISTARAFIGEAIDALALDMRRGVEVDRMVKVPAIEATIAEELDRIDRALGPAGHSMFAPLAQQIKQAMVALHGAKAALGG